MPCTKKGELDCEATQQMGPSQSFQTYHHGQHIRNTGELWIAMIKLRSWTNPKKLCVGIEKLKENFLNFKYTMLMSLKEVLLSMDDQVKGSVTFWNSNWNLRMNWLDKCVFVKGLEDPTSKQLLGLDGQNHLLVVGEGKDHVCVVCNGKHMKYKDRNPGVSCAKNPFKRCKTTIKCEKCWKYLCCNAKNMCFNEYHSKVCHWIGMIINLKVLPEQTWFYLIFINWFYLNIYLIFTNLMFTCYKLKNIIKFYVICNLFWIKCFCLFVFLWYIIARLTR